MINTKYKCRIYPKKEKDYEEIRDCINIVIPKSEEEMNETMKTCIHQKIEEEKQNRLLRLILGSI